MDDTNYKEFMLVKYIVGLASQIKPFANQLKLIVN